MAKEEQLKIILMGKDVWNKWRNENPDKHIDLSRADLNNADLSRANLANADLSMANLNRANLNGANLSKADIYWANLSGADLRGANLCMANLRGTYLVEVDVRGAGLYRANLCRADLRWANLSWTHLTEADIRSANLNYANLNGADLRGVNLNEADLRWANLSEANLEKASLTGCNIYAISAWGLSLKDTIQRDLIITPPYHPVVTVDDIEVAQFVYLLLHNEKIRQVIDTITSKVVLILGRFTPERKAVLDAIRDELRKRGYVPILFDFDKPDSRDITETVTTLARLARFIIADITDPKSIPLELQSIVPDLAVPVQPLLLEGASEFSMFRDLRRKYHWVLQVHIYKDPVDLFSSFDEKVIAPAVAKAIELRDYRT